MKRKIIALVLIVIFIILIAIYKINNNTSILKYNENKYVYLETKGDIFSYSFNNHNNEYYDPEIIYPVDQV